VEAAVRKLLAGLRRDLSQPDHRVDRRRLAEEGAEAAELMMPPCCGAPPRFLGFGIGVMNC